MTETEVLERTRAFVMDTYLYARPDAVLADDAALLTQGVIDSLGVMELVGFVEQTYGFTVDPAEITEAHFGSLRGIAMFVLSRQPR